jgi:ATP-binding cassette subfamily B multidrug efflux pump
LFIPRILKWVVDDLTELKIDRAGLLRYAGAIMATAMLIGLFRFVWRHCLLGTSRRVEEGLRNTLLGHLQTLSAAYFDRARTGDLMAHATNDIQQVRMAAGMGMVAFNDALVLGAAAIGFMAFINVRLTLLVLIPMPVIVFGTRFFSRRMHRGYRRVQSAFADLTEAVRERVTGMRVIQAYSWESYERARVEAVSKSFVAENLDLVKITGAFFPMMMFCTNLSLVIVVYFGGRQTIARTITPGDFVAFISYLGLLTWPMMAMGWVTNLIQRGKASLDRLTRILGIAPDIRQQPDAVPLSHARGALSLAAVSFAYGRSHEPKRRCALRDINLHLDPGRVLGIVGPPGSGKTTLLSLIPRLYDVTAGEVRLDGLDIRRIRIGDLRAQMAVVPQEPFLFAGTVRDNITLNDPAVSEERLVLAAEKAAVYETIRTFPKGFETVVGEKGVILSGGQKQRIALARALLLSPPILILDDPISQVDLETGTVIIDHLRQMAGAHTLIIASHRVSAVRFADTIVSLENGRIVESGTHDQLAAAGGYYAATWRMQQAEEDAYAT